MKNSEIKKRWETLLNPKRFRETTGSKNVTYRQTSYKRNPFDSDYSRVSLSAPFRRLQDKAQVFPLEKNDFARTRLTHSIEVSGLARSIGVSIENILFEESYLDREYFGYIPSILSVAGLIHDIGNPPFGHFGEKTIQLFFKEYFQKYEEECSAKKIDIDFLKEEIADFNNFDGNVQGLRLLLRLGFATDNFSFNLTFPTLASIIKYPKCSLIGNRTDYKENGGIEFKKFGFFQSEKEKFLEINETLGLNGHRHPLTYLLEAADDIAYSVSDIEDGCKKGTISWETIIGTLQSEELISDKRCQELLTYLEEKYIKLSQEKFPSKLLMIAQDCRIKIQGWMIEDVINIFMLNHEQILQGNFDKELIEVSNSYFLRKFTKKLAINNFDSKSVAKMELLGENVLSFLLENFIKAITSENKMDSQTKEGKLYNIISNHYKYVQHRDQYSNDKYKQLMLVTDYISGMTDTYALTLYQELKGMN